MRAVCYARVSSIAQREHNTIASQMRVLPEYVTRQGWLLVRPVDTYVDDGFTAKTGHLEKRLAFARLMHDASADIFDVVVVVDLDRLTRSESMAERGVILGAFQAAGVKVASVIGGEILDLGTEYGELAATIKAIGAAGENRRRIARSMEGRETAVRRGRSQGVVPYGLVYHRDSHTWHIDPVAGPIVREAFERIANGESCDDIARDFERRDIRRPRGLWCRQRVQELIRARYPIGEKAGHNGKGITIAVPAIVDVALWQRAQDRIDRLRRKGLRHTKHTYLLEGLGSCAACGGPVHIRSKSQLGLAGYVCRNRRDKPLGGPACTAPYHVQADVDARVWAALCRELEDPDLVTALAAAREEQESDRHDWDTDVKGYEAHLARLEKAEAALLARFTRGIVSEAALDRELADLQRRRAHVAAQLATASTARASIVETQVRLSSAEQLIVALRSRLASADLATRRELVQLLVEPGSVRFLSRDVKFNLLIPRGSESGLRDRTSSENRSREPDAPPLRIRLVV
jgi:site-specific DNA recombinase